VSVPVEVQEHRNGQRHERSDLQARAELVERGAICPQGIQQIRDGHQSQDKETPDEREATSGVHESALEAVLWQQKHRQVQKHGRCLKWFNIGERKSKRIKVVNEY